ncbi:MAG: hypothetical protein KBD55_01065 [Candidatus Pacebacteria bacterium]|jgi:hypothetical protein|nr:hypothetical protein [Candidatus Paceibacterota bacterium]
MIEIKDLLSRFRIILSSDDSKKESIISALNKTIKISLKKEDIKIKNNIIYLNIKPIYKNEILIKKEQIFTELKKSFGEKTPSDIR